MINPRKNRDRELPTFANINLLGKCNANCFFCLGKDIEDLLSKHNQQRTPYWKWPNFEDFLVMCKVYGIKKIYITGQNTDSLIHMYLRELVAYLQRIGFQVGLRTNGLLAHKWMDTINTCELSTGYSIHSLNPETMKKIWGHDRIPDWDKILTETQRSRVAIVINEFNEHEFFDIVKYVSQFPNVRYIQARRISTDTRFEEMHPHIEAYERVFEAVDYGFFRNEDFYLAQTYEMFGKEVLFWRTTETSVNSFNYFTDGTISDEYFIVEGYLKNHV